MDVKRAMDIKRILIPPYHNPMDVMMVLNPPHHNGMDVQTTPSTPLPFLRLPAEVRNRIYWYCLVVQDCLVPYPETLRYSLEAKSCGRGAARPNIALMDVNKQVRREAFEVYVSQNTWRITSWIPDTVRAYGTVALAQPYVWSRSSYRARVRCAVFVFSHRDIDEDLSSLPSETIQIVQNLTWRRRLDRMHGLRLSRLRAKWEMILNQMGRFTHLKKVVMDVEYAFCPDGLCRGVQIQWLVHKMPNFGADVEVVVYGILDGRDIQWFRWWRIRRLTTYEHKQKAMRLLKFFREGYHT